jgi:glycosyltransferase involved in cell wall biosynthesis
MPRVLRIINRLNIGGPTFNVSYLTRYLPPEYETLLVAGMIDETEGSSAYIPEDMGIKPRYIHHMQREIRPLNDYRGYREIVELIREFKPDIVHTHAAKAGALGRLAAHKLKVPVVVHTFHGHVFHSYFGPLKTRFFIEAERMLARRSSAIVAISAGQKQELAEQYNIAPAHKLHVVENGFDLQRFVVNQADKRAFFRNRYQLSDDTIAIGIVGRLVPVKNHRLFLDMFAAVKQQTPIPVRAFIVGDGELRADTEAYTQQLGLTLSDGNQPADVVFTSWIADVDTVNAGLDIIALTSLNEGTPVSLIEAQASARALVSTRVGGVADIVRDGQTGLLAGSGDVDGMKHATLRLVEDAELRRRMGEAGREYVLERFSYQRLCRDMDTLYRQLLASSKGLTGSRS